MNSKDIDNVVKTMEMMAELELVIGELYKACSEIWSEEAALWSHIALAEARHARNIGEMIAVLKKKPEAFSIGRVISVIAVKTAIAGVKENIQKLKKGELQRKQTLFILRDIEQSLLESKYAQILKTNDIEYNNLVAEITAQTEGHKEMLMKKIAAVQGDG